MAFVVYDDLLGFVDLYLADTVGPGPLLIAGTAPTTLGRANFPGMELRASDPNLGGGTFIFAKAAAAITLGAVCELTQAVTSGRYDVAAQPWAGAVNTGKPLCVAVAALASGNWGWFQVEGLAITTVSGAPAAGNPAYWQASGVISPTVVASKQVLNAQFATAVSQTVGSGSTATVLSATQALVLLNRPFAQGAIT
jgi:hypothetical protein